MPARPSVPGSVVAAWRTLKTEPIGLLLPSAGILLAELAVLVALRSASTGLPWPWEARAPWVALLELAVALHLARFVVVTPLRAILIATGARLQGLAPGPIVGLPTLWLVEGVIAAAQLLAWAGIAVPGVALTAAFVGARAITVGSVALAAALVGGAVAAFVVRVLLAYAPYEVIVGRRGPVTAIAVGWRKARGERLGLAIVLLLGDVLVAVGGLCCGAGALPGYPIGPLAVLHRWVEAREGA